MRGTFFVVVKLFCVIFMHDLVFTLCAFIAADLGQNADPLWVVVIRVTLQLRLINVKARK